MMNELVNTIDNYDSMMNGNQLIINSGKDFKTLATDNGSWLIDEFYFDTNINDIKDSNIILTIFNENNGTETHVNINDLTLKILQDYLTDNNYHKYATSFLNELKNILD